MRSGPTSLRGSPRPGAAGAAPRGARDRWRPWVLAARIPTLPAAVAPVLVGTAAAAGSGAFSALPAVAALVASLSIQIGTNLSNDAYDFLHGADRAVRLGPPRATASGLLSPKEVLTGAYVCYGVAALAGLYLVMLRGWPILAAGLLSVAASLAYTAGPWPLAYRGLGDLFVFIFFGIIGTVGSDFVQTGLVRPQAVWASVAVGLLTVAILVVNNLRDIETDRAAGKRTLAVRWGVRGTRLEYAGCLAGALAVPGIMRAVGVLGDRFWLPWLAVPLAGVLARTVLWRLDAPALNQALGRTARLLLLYSALLALALVLGGT